MIVELPKDMHPMYACHHAQGSWHIGLAWVSKTKGGWSAELVCPIGTTLISVNARHQGKHSKWCADCKAWLADRIVRQDFS